MLCPLTSCVRSLWVFPKHAFSAMPAWEPYKKLCEQTEDQDPSILQMQKIRGCFVELCRWEPVLLSSSVCFVNLVRDATSPVLFCARQCVHSLKCQRVPTAPDSIAKSRLQTKRTFTMFVKWFERFDKRRQQRSLFGAIILMCLFYLVCFSDCFNVTLEICPLKSSSSPHPTQNGKICWNCQLHFFESTCKGLITFLGRKGKSSNPVPIPEESSQCILVGVLHQQSSGPWKFVTQLCVWDLPTEFIFHCLRRSGLWKYPYLPAAKSPVSYQLYAIQA